MKLRVYVYHHACTSFRPIFYLHGENVIIIHYIERENSVQLLIVSLELNF
jgi:hypothetical protein